MNTANQLLKSVQDTKRILTKKYKEDMEILNAEENRLLKLINGE